MQSSSGEHYIALDHMRALAAFLVFSWHFLHGFTGFPITFGYSPSFFPFSALNEGHTGVALFMTLSGYLFAKLLNDKQVRYSAFYWNRFLRLFPLLILVLIILGLKNGLLTLHTFPSYLLYLLKGLRADWGNGTWSVVVELHFYLLLPFILFISRKSKWTLPSIILTAIVFRFYLHHELGQIQIMAYKTLIGRIDQFVLGILAFQYSQYLTRNHLLAISSSIAFLLFYWHFNLQGGFKNNPVFPSPSAIWIFLPTLEGLAYGLLISYYDNSFRPPNTGISKIIGRAGTYSYSIYLLHFFLVFQMPAFIEKHIMELSNFYVACAWSLVCFMLMLPIGYLSFRFIESPFLKFRKRYTAAADFQPGLVSSV
jgi:peptidoglycan/LPS O-acetylase OafA/YrhL